MRTTLTLEDDVAARLERLRTERDDSFKAIVNELMRRGLDAADKERRERPKYRITPHRLGRCLLPSLDNTADVLAWAEGEDHGVILVDTNLLVYAWNEDALEYSPARTWLEARLNGVAGVGLPWASLLGFTRIVTNPRIFQRAAPIADAWSQVDEWLGLPNVFTPEPTVRHGAILSELLAEADRPEHVPDAHLAALAIEYGLTLQSTDRDFARFSGLKWENPLESPAGGGEGRFS